MICFSVIHGSNYSLPRLSCKTCKKKFHSACLYRWFSTSNNSTCPLCRNLFWDWIVCGLACVLAMIQPLQLVVRIKSRCEELTLVGIRQKFLFCWVVLNLISLHADELLVGNSRFSLIQSPLQLEVFQTRTRFNAFMVPHYVRHKCHIKVKLTLYAFVKDRWKLCMGNVFYGFFFSWFVFEILVSVWYLWVHLSTSQVHNELR